QPGRRQHEVALLLGHVAGRVQDHEVAAAEQGQERQGEERQEAPPAAASAGRGVGPVRSMDRGGHSTRLVIPGRSRGASAMTLPTAKKAISEELMIRQLRRPIWSAISPEAATAPAQTLVPENCTIRNSPGERVVLFSASHAIGKIVTSWNSAKAASGTKAPR